MPNCKHCGEEKSSQGLQQHEKYCGSKSKATSFFKFVMRTLWWGLNWEPSLASLIWKPLWAMIFLTLYEFLYSYDQLTVPLTGWMIYKVIKDGNLNLVRSAVSLQLQCNDMWKVDCHNWQQWYKG